MTHLALADEPPKEYTARKLYIPYPADTSVAAFIAHLKLGSWERIEGEEQGWIYRFDISDQLSGTVEHFALQFEPAQIAGGVELSRALLNGEELSPPNIVATFGTLIENIRQESNSRNANAAAQAQAVPQVQAQPQAAAIAPHETNSAHTTASSSEPAKADASSVVPTVQSHCSTGEAVLFSCKLGRTNKIVSLCGSSNLSPTSGYLQYRFGMPGTIEIAVPPLNSHPNTFFTITATQQIRSQLYDVGFRLGKVSYKISKQVVGPDGSEDSVSLIVERGEKTLFSDLCASDVHDEVFSNGHLDKLIGVREVEKEDMQ